MKIASSAGATISATGAWRPSRTASRSEEHTSELQSQSNLVCRLLLEKKKKTLSTILNVPAGVGVDPRDLFYELQVPQTDHHSARTHPLQRLSSAAAEYRRRRCLSPLV